MKEMEVKYETEVRHHNETREKVKDMENSLGILGIFICD